MSKATKTITSADVSSIIKTIPNGHMFTATFVKANGETRKMNCRTGVVKYLNPNPSRVKAPNPSHLVTVYDVKSKGYRTINCTTVTKIVAEKRVFAVA